MQDAPSDKHAASVRATSARIGVIGSLALHAALVALLSWAPALPDVDFDLVLPSEVEFGVPEPEPAAVEAPVVAPAPPEPQAPDEPPAPEEPKPKPKPKPKPAAADAGTADAATPDAATATEKETPEPQAPSDKPALLSAFAPKGSQISVRMDVALVRASPLSEDVRLLL